ncbi:MAG TPA: hypothetical protein IGS17_13380 [Oscillatoriales cyanobacterium M59_W2019_021]|nr:MAG: hypothetical protein D6728_17500 [Cyanobacteria bacterium J055]HIK30711.1 hypothetical protein [Oscillatoriales cyanobacterium M4454_W2019_049]HIK51897.1 hypothetical protein [Oscillatoriales cyanobacterium M59_W2019_021]
MTYNIFDENYYLQTRPDVRAAVAAGAFKSGLHHFQEAGQRAGFTTVSPYWNEAVYLQANPDVAAAVAGGGFASGLDHYIRFGERENRPGAIVPPQTAGFDEDYYLAFYPNVAAAVAVRGFASGLAHYNRAGRLHRFEALFSGTQGDDLLTGVGELNDLIGVDVDVITQRSGNPYLVPTSFGTGEVDVLTGIPLGNDTFHLGAGRNPSNPNFSAFYVGGGSTDYAYIQNFTPGEDELLLGGTPEGYQVFRETLNFAGIPVNGVSIYTGNDLVAFVEGADSVRVSFEDPAQGLFFLS